MSKFKVLAGDYPKNGNYEFSSGKFFLQPPGQSRRDTYWASEALHLALADERSGVNVFGAAGWGTVGAVIAGPAGLLAGALLGGKGKRVVFVVKFRDGKKIVGETDGKTWANMMAASI